MPRVGNQYREDIKDTSYVIRGRTDGVVVLQKPGCQLEQWKANDKHAGYVVVIDGIGHEFISTVIL